MLKSERQKEIYALLEQNGFMSVEDISHTLYTSPSSVRRDLTEMEKRSLVRRSWGGAEVIASKTNVSSFFSRAHDRVSEKQIIAKKAKSLVRTGDVVFLDQSSTAFFLAGELMNAVKGITVVTNNLEILSLLSTSDISLYSSGGLVSRNNPNCLIGTSAQKTFESIYADVCFFSTRSLSSDGILSDCTEEEIHVRCAMMRNSAKKVFLCDSAKFNTRSPFIQCSLDDVDMMITENDKDDIKEKENA